MDLHPAVTHVALSFDKAYAPYAAVTALSAALHTSGPIKFHFQVHDLSAEAEELVSSTVRKFGAAFEFHQMDDARFSNLELGELKHLSSAAYYRLALPELVTAGRCVYLDCDTIVTCDLRSLAETDLQGAAMGGCIDPYAQTESSMTAVISDGLYINTGVLLLDMEQLRSINLSACAVEAHDRYAGHIRFADQCLLNKALDGRKAVLEGHWNVQAHLYQDQPLKSVMEPLDRSAIFHGSGPVKPWMTWSDPWLHTLWKSYARLLDVPLGSTVMEPRTTDDLLARVRMLEKFGDWQEAANEKGKIIMIFDNHFRQIMAADQGMQ